ncbi:hypothetical protein TgHK011_007622 [Trichoderma gracile]|nr:hypothetical protein TgHK011_007622 [Trichoderma gracile]
MRSETWLRQFWWQNAANSPSFRGIADGGKLCAHDGTVCTRSKTTTSPRDRASLPRAITRHLETFGCRCAIQAPRLLSHGALTRSAEARAACDTQAVSHPTAAHRRRHIDGRRSLHLGLGSAASNF